MVKHGPILVPLDGSTIAEGAMPYAEAVARAFQSELHLLIVAEGAHSKAQDAAPGTKNAARQLQDESTREQVLRTAEASRGRGCSVSTEVRTGNAAEQILAAGDDVNAELIVMATHGRGGLERWLVGSVADKVMRTGSRPTLLVVPSDISAPAPVEFKHLMVPLDGSPLGEAGLSLAVQLAQATGAALTLVQALPPLAQVMHTLDYVPDLTEWEDQRCDAAKDYLESVRRGIPQSLQSDTAVLRNSLSVSTLVDFARSAGIDLTVMSTHGHGGLHRLVVGSTADRFVRSAVPVLLVRPPLPQDHGGIVLSTTVETSHHHAVESARAAFAEQGFTLLAQTDLQDLLRELKGAQTGPYTVLSVVHPNLLLQALKLDLAVPAFLPRDVAVYASGSEMIVETADPKLFERTQRRPELRDLTQQLRGSIKEALEQVGAKSVASSK